MPEPEPVLYPTRTRAYFGGGTHKQKHKKLRASGKTDEPKNFSGGAWLLRAPGKSGEKILGYVGDAFKGGLAR